MTVRPFWIYSEITDKLLFIVLVFRKTRTRFYLLSLFFGKHGQLEKIEKIKKLTKFGRSWTG